MKPGEEKTVVTLLTLTTLGAVFLAAWTISSWNE
jgi:hypothetical protein